MECNYDAIDADDYSYHAYYIIKFSSSTYIFQSDLSIDGQVISSGKWYVKEIFFPINIISNDYVLQKSKCNNTIFALRKIINSTVNVICYD